MGSALSTGQAREPQPGETVIRRTTTVYQGRPLWRPWLLAGPIEHDDLVAEALTLLRASAGLDRARQTVGSFADQARAELAVLPPAPAADALHSLTRFLVERTR